ncbi:hypothetical protein GCM10011380_32030 [Sphingomonas metalli]|uniref:Uncharacterized protein n=1 Tax=Sphingomonas metalli TaxID=1779358 RepID=A0A916WYU4_9SPHN|nr:hypothetical protein [Sphingomonas metalli]GGB40163.1 hypothetical protein GCM10011380_32030 [Sphingomonas metalli]
MMVFNILRELDVLFGLAISEAVADRGLPPVESGSNVARLEWLQPHVRLAPQERSALRRLDGRRKWMERHASDASAAARQIHFAADQLAPAARLYSGLAERLCG